MCFWSGPLEPIKQDRGRGEIWGEEQGWGTFTLQTPTLDSLGVDFRWDRRVADRYLAGTLLESRWPDRGWDGKGC